MQDELPDPEFLTELERATEIVAIRRWMLIGQCVSEWRDGPQNCGREG